VLGFSLIINFNLHLHMKKLIFMEGLSRADEFAVFSLESVESRKLFIVRMDNNLLVHQKILQQMKFDYLWMLTRENSVCEEAIMRELERIENTEVVLIEASPLPY
jgi:hypothetical protein